MVEGIEDCEVGHFWDTVLLVLAM